MTLRERILNEPEPPADLTLLQSYPVFTFDDRARLENTLRNGTTFLDIVERPERGKILFANASGHEANHVMAISGRATLQQLSDQRHYSPRSGPLHNRHMQSHRQRGPQFFALTAAGERASPAQLHRD
jgi:hypothetical protein